MAQIKIRKYNPGGVLTTETGDTFTLEEIEQLVRENPTNENLKDIANEMRAGKNVQHSISDNWSSVTDDDFRAGQKRRIAKNPNSFGRRLAATFNTQVHQYGEDVNDTTALLSAARKNASTSNEGNAAGSAVVPVDEYTLISSGGGSRFVYDDNGAYVKGDFTNAKLMSLLRDLNNYFADDNGGASYKFKGISADVRKTLKEMYEANPNLFNDLMNKVQSGQIIEGSPEASLLLSIGIGSNMTKEQLEQAAKDKALKDYFVGKGFTEDQYKEFLPFVELDGQGLKLKAGVEGSPFIAGQNYYFNDDYNGVFKDLVKGQILFNNRFYDANQLAGSGMITDWVKALKEHRFTDADTMIKWDWKGVGNNYDYQLFNNAKYYNDFLNGKRYLDVTGQYEKTYDDNGNLYQIMGYYDPNDQSNYTALGFVDPSKIKYARFDSMGNLVDENYNTAFLRKSMSPWEHVSSFQGRRDDGQVEIPTITTRDGRGVLGMDVTFDPEKGTVQFHGGAVQNVLGSAGGDAIELDGEIAQILSPEFFANLEHSNKNLLGKFKDTILSLVGNKMGNTWTRNELSRREWEELLRPTYGDQAPYYANMLRNYVAEYIGRHGFLGIMGGGLSRQARLHEFTPKHQHGGLFTGSAVAASSAPKVVQSNKYMPATTEEAGAFEFGEFTDADWMELAGLGADLSSVVTGMAGLTPASVGTGLVGTGLTFMADIKRDGFQGKDLGNLGLGLLFDAASLVPGLGVAASSGQVVRTLKKGLPVLMKLAGIAGIGSSLSLAVNKIQSGEKITMRDLRVLMNGVLGAYTMAKQGVGFKNGKEDGVRIDADIKKMHMDEIDASNLSDGQKAALKRFFNEGGDFSAGLSTEQKAIYDQFIADGGDELALKMMLGDDSTFKTLRDQNKLLNKVKRGETLSEAEIKDYEQLMKDLEISRLGMSKADVERHRDLSADNERIKELLIKENSGTKLTAIEQAKLAGYSTWDEYKDFFSNYKSLSKEGRHRIIERDLLTATDDYNGSMFDKTNSHFGKDTNWAADVKNKDRFADDALSELQKRQSAFDQAQKDVDDIAQEFVEFTKRPKTTKSKKELDAIAKDIEELKNSQSKLETEKTDLETAYKTFWEKLAPEQQVKKSNLDKKDNYEKLIGEKDDAIKKVKQDLKKLSKSYDSDVLAKKTHASELKDIKDRSKAAKDIRDLAEKDLKDLTDMMDSDASFEIDSVTKKYRKSASLVQDVNAVGSNFKPKEGVKTKRQLQEELDDLLGVTESNPYPTRRMDDLDAAHLKDVDEKRAALFDELAKTKRKLVDVETTEYRTLSDPEKVEVNKILNKNVDDISEQDIEALNYYTSKARGTVTSDLNTATTKASENAKLTDDFTNFKLKDGVGLDEVTILLQKSGLPKAAQKRLSEVEWAKIRKADNPREELITVLKKNGVNEKAATKIANSVTEQINKSEKVERTWYGKKKKPESSSTTTPTEPDFKLKMDKFKTEYADDDTLKGKILGRSAKQRKYKDELYRSLARHNNFKNIPHRYYQPMIHGLHYNLMRDPVHHTPWYEPKEITIQLENEEE